MIFRKLVFFIVLTAIGLLGCACEQVRLGNARDKGKDAESTDGEPIEHRYAARSATPFFKRISDEAKPSKFLKKGLEVVWIEDDPETGFSKVRLQSKSVGYVPTRLLKQNEKSGENDDPETSNDNPEKEAGEADPEPETSGDEPIVPPGPRTSIEPGPRGNMNRRLKPHEIPRPRLEEIPLLPIE